MHKTPIQQRLLRVKSEKSDFVMIFVDNEFKMKWNWNVVGPLFWQIFYTVQPNMIVWGAAEKKTVDNWLTTNILHLIAIAPTGSGFDMKITHKIH